MIVVIVSTRRRPAAARQFFSRVLCLRPSPVEITTDRAPVYPRVLDEFVQKVRRGHYEHTTDLAVQDRVRVAFDELAACL